MIDEWVSPHTAVMKEWVNDNINHRDDEANNASDVGSSLQISNISFLLLVQLQPNTQIQLFTPFLELLEICETYLEYSIKCIKFEVKLSSFISLRTALWKCLISISIRYFIYSLNNKKANKTTKMTLTWTFVPNSRKALSFSRKVAISVPSSLLSNCE